MISVECVVTKEVRVALPGVDGYVPLTMKDAVDMYRQLHRALMDAGLIDQEQKGVDPEAKYTAFLGPMGQGHEY